VKDQTPSQPVSPFPEPHPHPSPQLPQPPAPASNLPREENKKNHILSDTSFSVPRPSVHISPSGIQGRTCQGSQLPLRLWAPCSPNRVAPTPNSCEPAHSCLSPQGHCSWSPGWYIVCFPGKKRKKKKTPTFPVLPGCQKDMCV
jgi:hypothetical protein